MIRLRIKVLVSLIVLVAFMVEVFEPSDPFVRVGTYSIDKPHHHSLVHKASAQFGSSRKLSHACFNHADACHQPQSEQSQQTTITVGHSALFQEFAKIDLFRLEVACLKASDPLFVYDSLQSPLSPPPEFSLLSLT